MDEKLSGCPFCGGKAKTAFSANEKTAFIFVECTTCGSRTRSIAIGRDDFEDFAYGKMDGCTKIFMSAIDRVEFLWNTRKNNGGQNEKE